MEEYEYMTASTRESWRTIVDAIFRGDCEIKRTAASPEGPKGFSLSVVWDRATHIENGREYRWKKSAQDVLLTDEDEIARGILSGVVQFRVKNPQTDWMTAFFSDHVNTNLERGYEYRIKPGCVLPPEKIKKLVDRTAEELIPLIGYIARKKRDGLYFMITSNQVFDQENMEIAPLGSDDWQPMQVLKECEA